ncbi:hypothetical protein B0J12DRAFT_698667 [Macrophomina phaseolina]|uniref:Uncharacterized protein n=1 Tax=Macrophomina phaseolina TaxID=35725 RepID=A0ABQ8GEV8_9PEZI|nr:hypothetical protein B0J12DRAFT_698667 [Macrophomina phaseolina]
MSVDTCHPAADDVTKYLHGNKTLRISLLPEQLPFVVMPSPRRKLQRPLTGAPAEIFHCLRSISDAKGLDVYVEHDESTRDCLSQMSSTLQASAARTPSIDYRLVYDNGVHAVVNCWSEYPCIGEGACPSWNPFAKEQPPGYAEAVQQTAPSRRKGIIDDATVEPGALHLCPSAPTPFPVGKKNCLSPAERDTSRDIELLPSIFDGEELLSPTEVYPTQEIDKGGAYFASLPGPASVRLEGERVQVPASSEASSDARRLSPSCVIVSESDLFPAFSDGHIGVQSAPRAEPEPPLFSVRMPLYDISQWLLYALKLRPDAHEEFRPQLLQMGLSARVGDLNTFEAQRDSCTQRLICIAAEAKVSNEAARMASNDAIKGNPWPADLDDQVEYVRRWLGANIRRNADLLSLV